MSGALSRGTLVIDVERCKGCELCIPACKPRVLTMTTDKRNEMGYFYPELEPGCTACHACALICPDFVFQVWRYDEAVAVEEEGSER
ncbi:MAG: 4Fe-4S binding protein [Novosphingobium sp.]|nr:4Fe-4S binding protein [Novosphingobium sp.]